MSNRREFLKQLLAVPLVIRGTQVITAKPEPILNEPLEIEGTFDAPYEHLPYNGRITIKGTAHNKAEREEFAGMMAKLGRASRDTIERSVFEPNPTYKKLMGRG